MEKSGWTATECARVLRRAGARQVWVATVARTLKLASNYGEFRVSDGDAGEMREEDAAIATAAGS